MKRRLVRLEGREDRMSGDAVLEEAEMAMRGIW